MFTNYRNLSRWLFLAALLILAACAPPIPPSPPPPESTRADLGAASPPSTTAAKLLPVRVCYSSVSGNQLPAWYAYEKGLFADYGLEVELQAVDGGDNAAAALIASEFDICQGSPAAMIAAAVQGADVITIAGLVNSSPYSLVVRPEIATAADLRGGAIAVNSLNGSAAVAARVILEHFGLQPDKDVAILAVGSQGDRLAAMKSGAVQATLASPPQTIEAKNMGFKILLDTADLKLPHQHTAVNTTRRYLSEHRPEAMAFMKAIITALASFEKDEAGVKETLAKYLELDPQKDAPLLDEAYTQLVKKYFVKTPYPTLAGIQAELDSLAADNPAAAKFKPADIVDTGIVQELEESGFVAHPHP